MPEFIPHPYQQRCIQAIIDNPGTALWLEMGLGKTATTLSAVDRLLYDQYTVDRVLIIAPKRVAEATWQEEARKWDNLQHLTFSTVLGSAKDRTQALDTPADIYIINRENVQWLTEHYTHGRRWPFDMVVIDEASSFKNHAAQRFKALRRVRPKIHKLVELTGTPAPNNLLDIWAQMYLVDQGERLGKYYTHYKRDWFEPDKRNGQQVFTWKPAPGAERKIMQAISDVVISVQAAGNVELPDMVVEDIPVKLSPKATAEYTQFERKCLLELDGQIITAQMAAALTGKLLQFCNGGLYDETHTAHEVHRDKVEAFSELIERLDGQKCLVFYAFQFDRETLDRELKAAHKGLVARFLTTADDAADWNAGKIDVLLAHPASCAYGLNLQQGGHHIVWYGIPYSLELYQQANARLFRQGQKHPVIVHRLIAQGPGATEDQRAAAALERKDTTQGWLMRSVADRIKLAKETDQ